MNRLFISLIFISSIFSQQTTVAVLEFDAEGIDNVSSSALASIVRKEVIKAANYKLVDRNSMNEILVEQGLSQSGCVSSECAVEVGKLLGVQQMISGTLSALGSLYLLDINIIDVTTGEIIKTESVEHIGKIEELISPLRKTVKSMLGGSSLNVGEALVYIESIPSGAMVYMNGISVGSAPLKHTIDTKSYNITLKADGYADWVQTIQGKSGETVIVKAELLESRASSGGGLASNEIGKWEVLGISRSEYVQFLRLGIDERDWIEKFQPIGITINDIKNFNTNNIPKEWWTKLASGGLRKWEALGISKNEYIDFLKLGIEEEDLLFSIENDISGEFARKMIDNAIMRSLWLEYKAYYKAFEDVIPPKILPNLLIKYVECAQRINLFINAGLIDNQSYKQLKNKFGSDVYYLFNNNTSFISETITIKIAETLNDKTLNIKNLNPRFLSWKQQNLNKLTDFKNSNKDKSHKIVKTVGEITVWEWIIISHYNIPFKNYLSFFVSSHPKG